MTEVFSYTCAGQQGENQDAFNFRCHPRNSSVILCALADGQGGRTGAAEAADLACRVCVEAAASHSIRELYARDTWIDILRKADHAVACEPRAGFTTLVAFCVTTERVCGGSCGDSAAILIRGRREGQILTAEQPKNPPTGSGKADYGYFQAALIRPWVLLAVSDGIWKYTGWEPLLQITHKQSEEQIVADLLRRAAAPTSCQLQDDFTLLRVAS
jgi:serine/threonine protein phosphatase PrpC